MIAAVVAAAIAAPAVMIIAAAMTPAVVVVMMVMMAVVIFPVTPFPIALAVWSGIGSALRPSARGQAEQACAQNQLMQSI
jgi:hypothetical protein